MEKILIEQLGGCMPILETIGDKWVNNDSVVLSDDECKETIRVSGIIKGIIMYFN